MTDKTTANDNNETPPRAISLTDLAAMSGLDEDVLLQRLAGILSKRVDETDAES